MKKHLLAIGLMGCISCAWAQTPGSWLLQGGFTQVTPSVSSGTLSAPSPSGTTVGIGSDTQPTLQLTYIYNDRWAVAVPLGTGFKHKLYGTGAITGTGQIGTVTALPISVFGQYRFGEPTATFRPYGMLGLSYAYFHDAKGSAALNGLNPINPSGGNTGLKVDSKLALSPGLGMFVRIDDRWFVDVSYVKTILKTTTTLSTGQTIGTTLNPGTLSLGVGVRF
jgi:outer membrane protein